MATMLRSMRYLKSILNLQASVFLHSSRQHCSCLTEKNVYRELYSRSSCRYYATKMVVENEAPAESAELVNNVSSQNSQQKLDRALYRLDMDVRRMGRINLRDVQDIFREIKATGSPSSTQSLLIIRCCGCLLPEELPESRTKLVETIWSTLKSHGAVLDVSHYNALLKVYLENEHKFSPTEFLSTMEKEGVEPNRVTYQRLIGHYCQQGDIAGASKILQFMKDKDLPINENVFNALIQGHARANDMANARAMLDVMRNAQLDPSPDTYTRLLCGYAEKGDIEAMRSVIAEAEKAEVQLLDRDYMEVILSLAVNDHEEHVPEILTKMRKSMGYNHDAVNLILQLVNQGKEDTAFKVLLTMPRSTASDGSSQPAGQFFIRQMVKCNRPKEKILSICEELKKLGLNNVGLLRAVETSLVFEKMDSAVSFLTTLKDQGYTLRPHYFWPILISHRKNKSEDGVYDTVKLMANLDTLANFDTFLEYVFPALNLQDIDLVVRKLKDNGHTVGAVVNPLVTYLVSQKDLAGAIYLIETYPVRLTAIALLQYLADAYSETKDLASVSQILKKMNEGREAGQRSDWTGQFLLECLRRLEGDPENLQIILEGLKSKNLGISHATADIIHNRHKKAINESNAQLLDELASSSLETFSDEVESAGGFIHPREMSIDELESHLIELKAKGMNTRGLMRRLLFQLCRYKNLERAMQVKEELDAMDFIYTPAMYAQLMDLQVAHQNLEKALEFREQMFKIDPNFSVDDHKILNLAALMVKNDLLQDAVKLISEHHAKNGCKEKSDTLVPNVWRLLNAAAEKGDAEGTRKLFDLVHDCGYCALINTTVGPLIKVHIVREDLNMALTEFENCCKRYRHTPWKNELFLRLIKLEDAERLQKVVDLSTEIHGEMNTMYDLAFAFIECGQIKQARKIMETPGFRAKHQRLDTVSEKFLENNQVAELEHLVAITKDLFDVDRDRMYYQLLRAYNKVKDVDKALGVWTTMQEENIQPSDKTLIFLAQMLKQNGRVVPFAVPDKPSTTFDLRDVGTTDLDKRLTNADLDGALEVKRSMEETGKLLSVNQYSRLIDELLKNSRLNEAVNVTKEMMLKNVQPRLNTLKFLLVRLGAAGDVEACDSIGSMMSDDLKRSVTFNNYRANAFINSGRQEELVGFLESGFPNNIHVVPIGGILGIMRTAPELIPRVEKLANGYAEHDFHAPLNMVWMHYFTACDYAKAEEIFQAAPRFKERLLFMNVIRDARENNDETKMRKLIDVVKDTQIAEKAKGVAYSGLVDILVKNEKEEDALAVMKDAESVGLNSSHFSPMTLTRLKTSLQLKGKPVPFSIPSQADTVSSESESSSDDERK